MGSIELWSLCSGRPVGAIDLDDGDGASCVCLIPGQPYVLIGCKSGDLRVGCLVESSGTPVSEGREVKSINLLPYRGMQFLATTTELQIPLSGLFE